ncbi:hypothetical protein [Acrocarpospora catenulata]|uniref:hypothetical protein n=1 Tax=Acrocarpospora catenulata TaxID=2836182 RepID=UPI001BD9CC8E|nr:hypothetical protein [Acrocarpospora catenulata]
MTELPPAVARFVADASGFERGTNRAVADAEKFTRAATKSALSARKLGIEAKEAAEKAARAQLLAAQAAEKAAKGFGKEEHAAELAAKAVRELERAEIKQAAAALASAEASSKAAKAHQALARDTGKAEKALESIGARGPAMTALLAAGLLALPVVAQLAAAGITVGFGAGIVGVGIAAAAQSQRVKDEFSALKQDVKAELQDTARPLEESLLKIPGVTRKALAETKPELSRFYEQMAPQVDTFVERTAESGARALERALPPLERGFGSFLDSFGFRSDAIFGNLEGTISSLAETVDEHADDIVASIELITGALKATADGIGWLVDEWDREMGRAESLLHSFGGAAGGALGAMAGDLDNSGAAVQRAAEAAVEAAKDAAASAGGWRELGGVMRGTAQLADDLRKEMDELNGIHRDASAAASDYQEAVDRATATIKKNGDAWSLNTEKGRQNQEVIRGMAETAEQTILGMVREHRTIGEVSTAYDKYRDQLIRAAMDAGRTEKQARALADSWLSIPESVRTEVEAETYQARVAFGEIFSQMRTMANGVTIPVYYRQYGPGKSPVGGTGILGRQPYMNTPRKADGGPVVGPGGPRDDQVAIWASNGEYVINAASTRKHRGAIEAINADRFADGGPVGRTHYASGGQVKVGGVPVPETKWRDIGTILGKEFVKVMTGSSSEIASMDRRLEKAIAKLFAGKKTSLDDKLIAYLDKNSKHLQALSKERDAAKKSLEEGKQYAGSVTSSARSFAGLTSLDGPMNAAGIQTGLAQKAGTLKAWGVAIKKLAARGLSPALIRQVIDAGPEQGLELANMLLSADKSTWAGINKVQKEIDSVSTSLGKSSADILYDSGKMAGQGFLSGLQASLKSLDKEMDKLAKSMAASLKKALKIKSPSQHPDIRFAGAMTVAGVAAGMAENLPVLDRSSALLAARLARPRIRPAVAPPVARGGRPGAATATGEAPIVNVRVVLDGRDLRAGVQTEVLRYERRNGHNGLNKRR